MAITRNRKKLDRNIRYLTKLAHDCKKEWNKTMLNKWLTREDVILQCVSRLRTIDSELMLKELSL